MSGRRRFILGAISICILAWVIAAQILGVQTWVVPSQSMEPTVPSQSRVVTFSFGQIERGDIVLIDTTKLALARRPDHSISRAIAFGGETITFEDELVHINGELLDEPYLAVGSLTAPDGEYEIGITIPEGQVFVLGDNRSRSADSRFYGPIPEEAIEANRLFVWWGGD